MGGPKAMPLGDRVARLEEAPRLPRPKARL